MIEFLAGAVTLGYVITGVCFLRFWRKTRDQLFLSFAIAFWLFACNQVLATVMYAQDDRVAYAYVLRVLGFLLILAAIVGKNASSGPRSRLSPRASPEPKPKPRRSP